MTEDKAEYTLVASEDGAIRLKLAYRSPDGQPINLDNVGAFFQVGDTKPSPGSVEGNTISFDIKKDSKMDLNGHVYRVILRDLGEGNEITIMRGRIRVASDDH